MSSLLNWEHSQSQGPSEKQVRPRMLGVDEKDDAVIQGRKFTLRCPSPLVNEVGQPNFPMRSGSEIFKGCGQLSAGRNLFGSRTWSLTKLRKNIPI